MSADQIRSIIDRINTAWLDGPPSEIVTRIEPLFHPDAVMYAPGFKVAVRGSHVIAASYRDFVSMATVESCTFAEPAIDVVANTATGVTGWTMTYTLNGVSYTESGHDVMVFSRDDAGWRVIWRTMIATAS